MNKNLVWAVIGVVVLGGLIYFMMGRDTSAPSDTEDETSQESDDTSGASGSFRDLLASGVSQRCTFSDEDSGSDGTVYVSGGKMRGDFSVDVNGSESTGHMIVKDNTFYTWMDGETQGFKMTMDADAQANLPPGQFDLDQDVQQDCDAAVVSDSQFDIPGNVTFTDFSSFGL